jgi:hypothetical protein
MRVNRSRRAKMLYQSHETPWSSGPSNRNIPRNRRHNGYGVNKPGALQQTLDALLTNEFERFFIQFGSQIPGDQRKTVARPRNANTYLTGILLNKSSSCSSSFICLSRTARYSHSRKSCSTSCHARTFSRRRATFTLQVYENERVNKE